MRRIRGRDDGHLRGDRLAANRDRTAPARLRLAVLAVLLVLSPGCERAWTFAVFGDSGIGDPDAPRPPVFPRIVTAINGSGAELAFFTGDLVYGRSLHWSETRAQYGLARELLRDLSVTLRAVPGNHDLEGPGSDKEYRDLCGEAPWVLQHRGWTFVGLTTEEPRANGLVMGEQLHWLEARLREAGRGGRAVVFLHRPVWPTPNARYGYLSLPQPELHRVLVEAGVKAVFAGHEHHFHLEERDGIRYVVTGGAGQPLLEDGNHHWVLVEVRRGRLLTKVVRLDGAP